MLKKYKTNHAFTLTETSVAIGIIAMVVIPTIAIWANSKKSILHAQDNISATFIAQKIIDQINNNRNGEIQIEKTNQNFFSNSNDNFISINTNNTTLQNKKEIYLIYTSDGIAFDEITKNEYENGRKTIDIPIDPQVSGKNFTSLNTIVKIEIQKADIKNQPITQSNLEKSKNPDLDTEKANELNEQNSPFIEKGKSNNYQLSDIALASVIISIETPSSAPAQNRKFINYKHYFYGNISIPENSNPLQN